MSDDQAPVHTASGDQRPGVVSAPGERDVPLPVRKRSVDQEQRFRRRRRTWLRGGVVAVLTLVAVAGVVLYTEVNTVRTELLAARDEVKSLNTEALAADPSGAKAAVAQLQQHTENARRITANPLWALASHTPVFGDDVNAVRVMSSSLDELADQALPTLVDVVNTVNPTSLAPTNGRIDTTQVALAAPRIAAALVAVQHAQARLAAVNAGGVLPSIAQPLVELRTQVASLSTTVSTASRTADVLPAMLGANGVRHYLVLAQNTAEQRALGGIPGAVMLIQADHGAVTVQDVRAGGSLSGLASPALALSSAEQDLFSTQLGTDMRDVTFTPDFPRAAALARGIWLQKVGGEVDGVISVDPATLAGLLEQTGPVTVRGVNLSSTNVVDELLSGVYQRFPKPADQDAFFAETSRAVFSALLDGHANAGGLVEALAQSAREGRLMVWSNTPSEQQRLAGTVLSGGLSGASGTSGVLGVYLNDGTQAKLGYYLTMDVKATLTGCSANGSQTGVADLTVTSHVPDNWRKLPQYVIGLDRIVPDGDVRTNLLLYAPAGGAVAMTSANPQVSGMHAQVHDDLTVAGTTLTLTPGSTATFHLAFTTGPGHYGPLEVRTTPLAHQSSNAEVLAACGS